MVVGSPPRSLPFDPLFSSSLVETPSEHIVTHTEAMSSPISGQSSSGDCESHVAGYEQLAAEPICFLFMSIVPVTAPSHVVQRWAGFMEQEGVGQFMRQVAVLACFRMRVVMHDHPAVSIEYSKGGEGIPLSRKKVSNTGQCSREVAQGHNGDSKVSG